MRFNIKIAENVLTTEQCVKLISYLVCDSNNAPVLDYNSLKRTKVTEHEIVKTLAKEYDLKYDRAFVMHYPRGVGSPLHVDNYSVENKQEVTHSWKDSVVVFLNEDFGGGELVYPNQGITIKPKTGNMIVAPADFSTPHFVNPASLDRYVLVLRINT
jgi:hypothetical protein